MVGAMMTMLRTLLYRQHNLFGVLCGTLTGVYHSVNTHCLGYHEVPLGDVNVGARGVPLVRVSLFRVKHTNTPVPLILRAILIIFGSPLSG